MDHPLRLDAQKHLRQRVIQLLKKGFSVRRSSNIVFVCGGNKETHMRHRFKEYCALNLKDYEIFLPEFAMDSYFRDTIERPFDIAKFEELVGALSLAIVVFPEAPGSFAETGYFSAISPLASKTILVLDSTYQSRDSFLSLGPAMRFDRSSMFHPTIQIDYSTPDFKIISERIKRVKHGTLKHLELEDFKKLSDYELFSLIGGIVRLLTVATYEDILFVLYGIFSPRISKKTIKELVSILVGSSHLLEVGEYGHYTFNSSKEPLLYVRDGSRNDHNEIRLMLADIYQDCGNEFLAIMGAIANAH